VASFFLLKGMRMKQRVAGMAGSLFNYAIKMASNSVETSKVLETS
jgi:hypothetical protein